MLPEEYGDKLPSWADLDNMADEDITKITGNKQEKATLAEEATENQTVE